MLGQVFLWNTSQVPSVPLKKITFNPRPHMRGPCGPRKTLPGAPAAFFGTPEPTLHLIFKSHQMLQLFESDQNLLKLPMSGSFTYAHALHTFQTTALCFWGLCGPCQH